MANGKTPWASVVSLDDIQAIYAESMKHGSSGSAGPAKAGCLEGCLGNAWTAEQYRQWEDPEAETGGFIFAVYLMRNLIKDHCFADGNKRVGWFSLVFVLERCGLSVNASDNEACEITEQVAGSSADVDDIIGWLLADDRLIPLN